METDTYQWILENIPKYKEWYMPVDFGNGVVAYTTNPPDWKPHPEALNHIESGMGKWNYIIKRNLPDVKGKRVLDIGCSSGLFCIEMTKLGAREVIGIDRDDTFRHKSGAAAPVQNVVKQAEFVKEAFERLNGTHYNITYKALNIANLDRDTFGQFDIVLALCVVYHELDRMQDLINRIAGMTKVALIQANNVHTGNLGKYSCGSAVYEAMKIAGFKNIQVDAPEGYMLPLYTGYIL